MRIAEMAGLAGVSTRTVRHYHQVGVMPEPARTASGYRDYGLDDLIRLVHARRLVELGLGLAEVAETLRAEAEMDLTEVLDAIDADLAEQERQLAARRAQLAVLRTRWQGELDINDLGHHSVAEFRRRAIDAGANGPSFELDHQVMALLPQDQAEEWILPTLEAMRDPDKAAKVSSIYARFDALGDGYTEADLEEFVALAREIWPPELLRKLRSATPTDFYPSRVLDAVFEQMTPHQRAAAEELLAMLMRTEPT